MFTGIIEALGSIAAVEQRQGDLRLTVNTGKMDLSDVRLGDSIAVNGVCLTVVQLTGEGFVADLSRETLAYTRFGSIRQGEAVNLEKALRADSRLGGHMVSGHVDGIGKIANRREDARSIRFDIAYPEELGRYIAAKGSITVDGTSLTVTGLVDGCLQLNIVPHTASETILSSYKAGDSVHLEVDLIARYLERLLSCKSVNDDQHAEPSSGLTAERLAEYGFTGRRGG